MLLLVGLPLVFELGVTGVLLTLLHESEKDSAQARHAREVIAQDLVLQQLIVDCLSSIGQYFFIGSEPTKEKYREAIAQIPVEFDKLSLLLAGDPVRLEQSKKIEGITADAIKMQGDALDAWQNGNRSAAFLMMPDFKKKLDVLTEAMDRLVEIDRSAEFGKRESEVRLKGLLTGAIVIGVIGNVLLSVLLAIAFDRSTTRRLQVLMRNIGALSERKPLAGAVGGDDEVGELDAVFHKMAADLKQLERTKAEFVAMVSHDLRAPLSSILMSAEMWADGYYGGVTEQQRESAVQTCANAQRLINLVNTLLDLEKIETGQLRLDRTEVSANTVLLQSAQSVEALAAQRHLTVKINACDEMLLLDSERIVQVLVNLLSNGIKFSPDGASIALTAVAQEDDVVFSVADQGRGIPNVDCEKIFERFYQVSDEDRKNERGIGLGLAICKKIVEEHGGRIGVESEEGRGSRFWFTIPR